MVSIRAGPAGRQGRAGPGRYHTSLAYSPTALVAGRARPFDTLWARARGAGQGQGRPGPFEWTSFSRALPLRRTGVESSESYSVGVHGDDVVGAPPPLLPTSGRRQRSEGSKPAPDTLCIQCSVKTLTLETFYDIRFSEYSRMVHEKHLHHRGEKEHII